MGGGSSRSDSSQTTNTENYNFQGVEGPAVVGQGNTVNMTGDRAFTFAENFGGQVIDMQENVIGGLFQTLTDNNNQNLQTMADQSKSAMDIAERTTRSDQTIMLNSLAKYMGGGMLFILVLVLFMNHQRSKKA